MYELGAKSLVTKPGVTKIGTRGLSKFQAEQVFILSERAKKLGLEIVLVTEKLSDGDGRAVNALYMEGTNRVVLSLQSDLDLLLVHAGHEIFHWAKSQNKEMTQRLQNMVINVLKSDNRYDYEGIYNQVSAEYEGLSEEEILEEIAAQYMGVVFADESSIRKTVEEASEQERGFLKKVIDYLKDFIKSLKELIRIYGDRDKAVRAAVETPVEQLEYFAETFERILEETAAKKKPATDDGGVKASLKISENIPTVEQIEEVRKIGRKSVNSFSSAEIEKTEYWAKMFLKQLGQKSPFFRAWFGDWRSYETNKVSLLNLQLLPLADRAEAEKYIKSGIKDKTLFRGDVVNSDTGFSINVGSQVYDDTLTYSNRRYSRDKNFYEYIVRLSLLQKIDKIVKDAILLDSFVSDSDKNPYQSFMHKFYAIANVGGKDYLVKLTVDELNSSDKPIRRAYNVNGIRIAPIAGSQVYKPAFTMDATGESISNISISNLFEIVKEYDNEFNPNPVNPAFLNNDGTPKVFYHGTNADFTVFDRSKRTKKVSLNVMGDGNYFTTRRQGAEHYGGNVIEAYIKIDKPYIFRNSEFQTVSEQITNDFGLEERIKGNQVQQFLKEKGYDGVVLSEDGKAVMVNAFDSEQIKSATDNIGTFDRTKKDIRYSRALSSDTKEKVLKAYDIANLNDSIEVQRKVFSALQKSGFFTDGARVSRVDVNEESGMEIETNKSGINETFSYKNFVINSNDTKIIKLATITSLPSVIKRGKLIYDNVKNAKKDNSGVKYAYLIGSVTVDGNTYDVKLTIRKSLEKNKFWVHHIYIKNDTAVASDAAQLSESSALQTNGVNESVSQGDGNVNKKYSRQRINESWEDIRTKMYENEVHEEIIGEIEAYIDRLKNRKLERETEITEGLIPKYEAILKVAREYTKGSDVSAHQLADTINELMWAAHDGNLDTKQFIATVRLITEDIIRTGRKINDDKYRQYEDFRRMTREETVFVERRV